MSTTDYDWRGDLDTRCASGNRGDRYAARDRLTAHIESLERKCTLYEAGEVETIRSLEADVEALCAACDAVGIPHSVDALIQHHRGNAGMAAAFEAMADVEALVEAGRACVCASRYRPANAPNGVACHRCPARDLCAAIYPKHELIGAEMVDGIALRLRWSKARQLAVKHLVLTHLEADNPLRAADFIGKAKP